MQRIGLWILFLLLGLVALPFFVTPYQPTLLSPSSLHLSVPLKYQVDQATCPGAYQIPGTDFCTHGADPAPAGFAIDRQVQPLPHAQLEPPSVLCDGDGTSGPRIQVLYVRTTDAADRYAEFLPSIRAWVSEVDGLFASSAQATAGVRHLRFVTNVACQIDVDAVEIPTGADKTFAAMITALSDLGYDRADRKYLLLVDANVLCGTGTILHDSQPGPENRNNIKSGYARIDNGCWGSKPLAHELIHTLGGVQHDAPHSSQGWHCTDEYDIMCYSDSPHRPAINILCPDVKDETQLDCNHDDYFHTAPPAGSYLATHWNVANSAFLIPSNTPTTPPEVTLIASATAMTLTTPVTLTLRAPAIDHDGRVQRVEFYLAQTLLTSVVTPTYTYTWVNVPTGIHTFYAKAYDELGASQLSAPVQLVVTDPDGLINTARGQVATQASTDGDRVAAKAVDGIIGDASAGSSTAQTLVQSQPWWQVDLGTEIPLEKVHIWGSTLCCADALTELEVLIAATPILTQNLSSALVQPGVAHYRLSGNTQEPLTLPLPPGQSGRYLLIGAVTTGALALTEVEVMTQPAEAPVGGQNGPDTQPGGKVFLPVVTFTRYTGGRER